MDESRKRAKNPEVAFRAMLKYRYGLSLERWAEMLAEQGGRCAICRVRPTEEKRLSVDHDHETGENRGLLCQECNLGLGKFRDNTVRLRAAADYLERERG
jgi:hypothetical protein